MDRQHFLACTEDIAKAIRGESDMYQWERPRHVPVTGNEVRTGFQGQAGPAQTAAKHIDPIEVHIPAECLGIPKRTEPISNPKGIEPMANPKGIEPVDNSKGIEPVDNSKSIEPKDNSKGIEPVGSSKNIEPIETSKYIQPMSTSRNIEPTSKSTQPMGTSRNIESISRDPCANVDQWRNEVVQQMARHSEDHSAHSQTAVLELGHRAAIDEKQKALKYISRVGGADKSIQPHSMRTTSEKLLFLCEYCGRCFQSQYDLIRHIQTHSEDGRLLCEFCDHTFQQHQDLIQHLDTHPAARKHQCTDCKQLFTNIIDLHTHMAVHGECRPHICHACGKSFKQKPGLTQHLRIHTGDKPYTCEVCFKSFTQQSGLIQHSRIHTGSRPYDCKLCDKSFAQQSGLDQHTRIHTGDKPYICTKCQKTFRQRSGLDSHMYIHSNSKTYTCDMCDKSFIRPTSLETHKKTHTGGVSYKCVHCDKEFLKRKNLYEHLKTHAQDKKSMTSTTSPNVQAVATSQHQRNSSPLDFVDKVIFPPAHAQDDPGGAMLTNLTKNWHQDLISQIGRTQSHQGMPVGMNPASNRHYDPTNKLISQLEQAQGRQESSLFPIGTKSHCDSLKNMTSHTAHIRDIHNTAILPDLSNLSHNDALSKGILLPDNTQDSISMAWGKDYPYTNAGDTTKDPLPVLRSQLELRK